MHKISLGIFLVLFLIAGFIATQSPFSPEIASAQCGGISLVCTERGGGGANGERSVSTNGCLSGYGFVQQNSDCSDPGEGGGGGGGGGEPPPPQPPDAQLPDLVGYVGGVVNATVNNAATLYGSVSNVGPGSAGLFANIIWVCDANCATVNEQIPAGNVASLSSGASEILSASYTPTQVKQLYYAVCVDSGSNVTETNEDNNCSGWQVLNVGDTPNQEPIGNLDMATCETGGIAGWAYDPSSPNTAIDVHFYIGSTIVGSVTANQYRGDLGAYGNGQHGFNWSLPEAYKNGNAYRITAYAIDSTGGTNPSIGFKDFSCADPVQPPPPPDNLQFACNANGTEATLSWNPPAGATNYYVRMDDPTNNSGSCTDGWFCSNPPDRSENAYTGTSITYSGITPGQAYNWWVHGANSAGIGAPANAGFNCPAVSATQADLVGGAVAPASGTVGTPIMLWADVSNIGGAASGSFPILFQVMQTGERFNSGYLAGLAPGASAAGNASHTFSTPGTYQVRACANFNRDWVGITPESNYGNNCGPETTITVTDGAPTRSGSEGYLDYATCEAAGGWAYDPDVPNQALEVHIYIDGVLSGATTAGTYRSDLSAYGNARHGFSWALPESFKDNAPHSLRAYAIDANGGTNPELNNSPRSFQCEPTITWCTTSSPELRIEAIPNRVRARYPVSVTWSASGVNGKDAECTVTGPGISWSDPVSLAPSCSVSGSANPTIYTQSTYTLRCGGVSKSVTVNVVPNFQEF